MYAALEERVLCCLSFLLRIISGVGRQCDFAAPGRTFSKTIETQCTDTLCVRTTTGGPGSDPPGRTPSRPSLQSSARTPPVRGPGGAPTGPASPRPSPRSSATGRTRTNTLPMAVETRGERRRLSPKTSARACAVWCSTMNMRVL